MARLRWLTRIARQGLELWLPLLLVTVGLWYGSQWLNHQVLSQTYPTPTQLNIQQQPAKITLTFTILSIDAEIDRRAKNTEVNIRTADSPLQELEFLFPVTQFAEVEQTIAQELKLSPQVIRNLIRYRID